MTESIVFWVFPGCALIAASIFLLVRRLEQLHDQIDKLRRENFETRQLMVHSFLVEHHPDLSDSEVFELELEEERHRRSSLGQMLITAKENARGEVNRGE